MTEETLSAAGDVDNQSGFVDGVGDEPPISAADLGIELPDGPHDAVEMLLGELGRARAAVDERTDDLKRLAAEFDNYRKRKNREEEQQRFQVMESIMRELLPVLDSFDAGLQHEPESEGERRLLGGLAGTANQLHDALARLGLEAIPAVGEPFDPAVHEAVMAPPGVDNLEVTQELQRGYTFQGKVLRAAMVALGESSGGAA